MMHDCANGAIRDLLPDYVNGRLSEADRAMVATHLDGCVDCTAELGLIEAVGRAYPAPAIDFDRILRALPGSVTDAARPARSMPRRAGARAHGAPVLGEPAVRAARFRRGLALAAGLGVIVFGVARSVMRSDAPPQQAQVTTPGARGAGPAVVVDSRSSAAVAPSPVAGSGTASRAHRAGISFGGGLSDLSDEQLDTLLGELDALDALPSVEPDTHLSPIVPQSDGGHNAR